PKVWEGNGPGSGITIQGGVWFMCVAKQAFISALMRVLLRLVTDGSNMGITSGQRSIRFAQSHDSFVRQASFSCRTILSLTSTHRIGLERVRRSTICGSDWLLSKSRQ